MNNQPYSSNKSYTSNISRFSSRSFTNELNHHFDNSDESYSLSELQPNNIDASSAISLSHPLSVENLDNIVDRNDYHAPSIQESYINNDVDINSLEHGDITDSYQPDFFLETLDNASGSQFHIDEPSQNDIHSENHFSEKTKDLDSNESILSSVECLNSTEQFSCHSSEIDALFPEIIYDDYQGSNIENNDNASDHPPSIIALVDDTESLESVCIDESIDPLESMARAIMNSTKYTQHASKKGKERTKGNHRNLDSFFKSPFTQGSLNLAKGCLKNTSSPSGPDLPTNNKTTRLRSVGSSTPIRSLSINNNESMDFENYKRQTATQILADRQRERREQRQLRRRSRALKKEQYFGNYFRETNANPDSDVLNFEFSQASYAIDHFNGHRQQNQYSHPSGEIYTNGVIEGYDMSNFQEMMNSGASMRTQQTDNIDDMSSHDVRPENGLNFADYYSRKIGIGNSHIHYTGRKAHQPSTKGGITQISRFFRDTGGSSSHGGGGGGDGGNIDGSDFDSDYESSSYYDSDASSDTSGAAFGRYHLPHKGLKRKLYSRHLTSIGAASSIGISSMLMFGHTLFSAGPLGALLGYFISGAIMYSIILGYAEIVSLLPLHTGIPGTIARTVNPSMGYAIGICYWLSNAMALPAELTAAAMMLTNYPDLAEHNVIIVWIIYIFFLVILVNVCSVRIYGEFQFVVNLVRIIFISLLTLLLIILNITPASSSERLGFRFWISSKSTPESGWYYGPFRPLFPLHIFFDDAIADQVTIYGISGSLGRFTQVCTAIIQAPRAYLSSYIVFSSVGEVRNPRKSLPRATKYIFWQIICFYIIVLFVLGINVYAGDSDLYGIDFDYSDTTYSIFPSYTSNQSIFSNCDSPNDLMYNAYSIGINVSPWIIALQSAGLCSLASAINAIFVVFAVSSGSSHLYASSRTLYGIVRLYIEEKKIRYPSWWNLCGWCNDQGVPTYAVLASFPFALLALKTITTQSFFVFQNLLILSASASVVTWVGMSIAFLRFYTAIQSRRPNEDTENQSRNQFNSNNSRTGLMRDELGYPFKSPFQPYLAWFGLFGSLLILFTQGFKVFIKGSWNTSTFVAHYVPLLIFFIFYMLHKILTGSRTKPAIAIDLDSGRRELDRAEWIEDRKYNSGGITSVWRWILGRFRFIKVFIQTILGDSEKTKDSLNINEVGVKKKKKKKKKELLKEVAVAVGSGGRTMNSFRRKRGKTKNSAVI
ncbi:uncharacterized protein SAPINGB_P002954 [Magnusiomyces paraingens]|uniref:Amino acid permease/ SLC12A domain-containing protein n=1 Tax=Magnusiomyces paraingens TaxID=2606893 RepID=A0A5E8BHI3_9ASCO|nr:uncharacterized protein SAPINGB_P002954 [Saprochaete ingens]VVT51010.1 unnamed protein product [Saprochaete ingens]